MAPKSALVTGGGRGIGRAIVLELVRRGWTVTFSYRSDRISAQATLADCKGLSGSAIAKQSNTGSPQDRMDLVQAALEPTGRIDLLVNNAGMAPRQRVDLLEISEASFDEVMLANLKGPFFLTTQVAQNMIAQVKTSVEYPPRIINIGSMSAYTSSLRRGEYCLSKAGLAMMTSLFADRLAYDGILVYEIRPGIIETDMTSGVHEKYDQLITEGLLPIHRWGKPEDVALAVAAIAEGYLPYSTGEVINVDGGFHLRKL
jgi:3-oxoacyl-[acyl-carrier protein] reductase